ncbi:MAG TPA: UDP-N-acetylmuramoylalanyl-D-glutamyl-2,6-diaminopimelate--D-alanyl-D-alanine ligase [Xanthobacteraceae bacterium]|nr:UDP-N-acetylmuramoylalanyl-D-glutamyl-2,6-diaminopimelate--D-alanyl-D-alanine ligase [Xanthobacteraceae bacterium]
MSGAGLWTAQELAQATRGRLQGDVLDFVTGISIDTRTLLPGEAFFAIKGDRLDGHDYVAPALEKGAALAVVEEASAKKFSGDTRLLIVPDTLQAMRDAGVAARARSQAQIIAVTGSAGKTGTKEALRLALSPSGETHASSASFNNHWGVPLSLARLSREAKFGVFEIGMNHAGEITPLVQLVRPQVAIITTIEPVHLEYFSGIEAIADAKAEIFTGIERDGAAILNRDNSQFARLEAAAKVAGVSRIVSFGASEGADARMLEIALQDDSSTVHADILGEKLIFKLGAPGRHLAMNALAVLAAAKIAGADLAKAAIALGDLVPPAGRGLRMRLRLPGGEGLLIDESYNANPASMRAAIEVLSRAPVGQPGRRIAVLGDMLELGAEATLRHAELAESLSAGKIDLVYCSGPLMQSLWEALPSTRRGGYAEDAAALEPQVLSALQGGDAVMIKGSNASGMGKIVKSLTQKFGAVVPPQNPA